MNLDILAVGAHPDDVELYAGGTIVKMAALGYAVGVVDLTRGELGTRGTADVRADEAQEAAAILGLKTRENLRFVDGNVTVTSEARLKVIQILRKYRPKIVLSHYWDDSHPDHVHASRLVSEAVHHSGLVKIETGQERHRPPVILYFKLPLTLTPSFVVDVSNYADRRAAAIAAHHSQLHIQDDSGPQTVLSRPDFLTHLENLHSYYGMLIGKSKGEAFYFKGVQEIKDLLAHFS